MQDTLTPLQAYKAMYAFLDAWYSITKSDDFGSALGSMSILPDGGTADPAIWDEWMEAVRKAIADEVDIRLRFVDGE